MAQQITIDIVAETKKLTQGLDDANKQLGGIEGKLSSASKAAVAFASGFILTKGVAFLKDATEEARSAEQAILGAESAFGAGSKALQKITEDADKFGIALGMDNDDLIVLATQLGVYLPESAKGLSVELLNLGADVASLTGVDLETWTKKFAKGMADGELKAGDLEKMLPGLNAQVYAQAAAMFESGKSTEALNLLIAEGATTYGDAAEKKVTSSKKLELAIANLKEQIGTKLLPIIDKFVNMLVTVISFVDRNRVVMLPLIAVIGVLSAAILVVNIAMTAWSSVTAAWTTITGIATAAQRLFNLTMLANPIGLIIIAIVALIAIIVLLVKNWDTVTEVVGKVWKAFKDFVSNAIEALGNLYQSVKNILQSIKDIFTNAFNEIFNKISSVIERIISAFSGLPGKLFDIGKSLATGLWDGLASMTDWLRNQINAFFGKLVPSFAKKALGISSPSKVFAAFGEQIVEGLAQGISTAQSLARDATFNLGNTAINGFAPRLATATNRSPIYITINAGLGTDPYKLGREVNSAISKYGKVSSKVVRG